ncbi:MAG: DNA recombination protein RmuC [Dehalococcoidia bacterium]
MAVLVLVIVVAVVVVAVALMIYESRESRRSLAGRIGEVETRLGSRINTVQESMTSSLSTSSDTVRQVTERLAGIDGAAKRIVEEVGPSISDLRDILKPAGLRGGFGEVLLEQLLKDALPSGHFEAQYQFRGGERVDFVIHLPEGLVPVDSKFPLESFNRLLATQSEEERERERKAFVQTIKKHIDAVAKYIVPDEGTLPFALVYIPSESVYYEVVVRDEVAGNRQSLMEYARQKNVFPVSPNTLYALLQAIAKGLRGLQVERQAREIIDHLERLQGDFSRFKEDFRVLGSHLRNAEGKYREVDEKVDKLERKLAHPLAPPEQLPLPSGHDDGA